MLKGIKPYSMYFISFFLPAFILGMVFIFLRVYPFGGHSTLMADQFTQYIQFYNHFYDTIKGDGSLLYSWEAGMGLNYWGTFAYYLSSPLSFTVLLFDRDNLPEAFIFMTLVKIGLAGLMMSLYLRKIFQPEKLTALIFSTIYALMSFSIGFFFNIMWLDSIYLLPLVLLGVEKLLNQRYLLFIVSLALLFVSNFYMAYIVGIFTFLYFLIRSFSKNRFGMKVFLRDFLAFMISTLIAGGLSAFVTVPTYLQLKTNYKQAVDWSSLLQIDVSFVTLLAKLYNGGINLLEQPNVYSGLLVLLLFPLFFLSKKISVKEKLLFFGLLFLLILSFEIRGLNIVWHAFEMPTGYLHRFAFVFSFTLIYLAFRALTVFEKEQIPSLFKIALVNIFMLVFLTEAVPEQMSLRKALFNMILIILFSLLLYAREAQSAFRKFFTVVILFCVMVDVGVNAYQHVKTLNSYPGYNFSRNQYNFSTPGFEQLVKDIAEKDPGFYRINSTIRMTQNDSLRLGYKGMTNFNTLANGTLHEFMYNLGYSTTLGARSLTQNNGVLASDALLGFKYALTDQPVNKHGYTKSICKGTACLYENENALPAGFMIGKKQIELEAKVDDPFLNQNTFLGGEGNYFKEIKPSQVKYNNLSAKEEGTVLYVKKADPNQEGSIEMTFDLRGKKQFYTLLSAGKGFPGYNETTIYVNGKSLGMYPTFHYERILDLGAFANEQATVKIVFSVPETQLAQRLFYELDMPSFEERIQEIKKEAITVNDYTETSMTGQVAAKEENPLFLSIPYDKGWKAKVDGKEVSVIRLGGFIGINLEPGTHKVELYYTPSGFNAGCIISISTLLALLIAIIYTKNRKKGKRTGACPAPS